jgi:phospholipid-transporting ATPase
MRFQKCSIAGISYGDTVAAGPAGSDGSFFDPALLDNLTQGHTTASYIREWLTLLAVCHTVIPERDRSRPDTIVYQAASPDERALVEAVKYLGFSFNVRTPEGVVVSALGQEERYEVLNVLEFNSTRKRMSVIVRCPGGALKLYCKGADSVILARLAPGQKHVAATEEHLRRFAADGLRTLCLAVAPLSEEAYQSWLATYSAASTALVNRAQRLDDAAELIEKNLILLGATAIEDRLQDDVPNTIRKMSLAGIKVWVLTGDKLETAINIGYACRLLTPKMRLLICSSDTEDDVRAFLTNSLDEVRSSSAPPPPLALVIEGASLLHALSGSLRTLWLDLALLCPAVICCRVSPAQKADVVRLVRNTCKAITLAIGDGANDVGMIQAAHVGVGISGREGLQAARAADYSIAQFRFLQKLLLVHGAWSYRRVTLLILYCFYKNVALYLIQFWFATQNGWSGQILFERWNIALYNVLFTLLPPLALGMFQQHASASSLLAVPALYRSGQRNEHFNTRVFWLWILQAIAHSLVFFWLGREAFRASVVHSDGTSSGMWVMGAVVYSVVVYTVCLKAALATTHWTAFNHVALWGSMVIWILFTLAYFNLYAAETTSDIAAEVCVRVNVCVCMDGYMYICVLCVCVCVCVCVLCVVCVCVCVCVCECVHVFR